MSDLIQTAVDGPVFHIRLNRPEKRNAINLAMLDDLAAALGAAEQRPHVRVVMLGSTTDSFSAGIDLNSFFELPQRYGPHWARQMPAISADMQAVFDRFARTHLPIIALLNGYCLGLALELALACDFILAVQGTQLGLPETRLGLIPDVGGTTRLTLRVGPARAKTMILTGRRFTTAEVAGWGLIDQLVPDAAALDTAATTLAGEIIQAAPLAVAAAKRVINGVADTQRGLHAEALAQAPLMQSKDFMAGVQAMLSKQPVDWQGA